MRFEDGTFRQTDGGDGDGPEFVKVHIYKYLVDGYNETQIPNESELAPFPMVSTWTAENLNGGVQSSGSYVLGNNEGGTALDYAADTSDMTEGADYTTSEVTDGSSQVLPIGASCEEDMFRLVGYRSSEVSLEDAQTVPLSEVAPAFTDLQDDAYVIVVNEDCDDVSTLPPTLTIIKNTIGGEDDTFYFALAGATSADIFIPTVNGTGSSTITLEVGTTTVIEFPGVDWEFTDAVCEYDGNEAGVSEVNGESVYVENGDEVTCTFTNTFVGEGSNPDSNDTPSVPGPSVQSFSNGGGGGGSHRRGGIGGSSEGEVAGATTDTGFCPYLIDYLKIDGTNDPDEVNKAKAFFNSYMSLSLLLNGIFDQSLFGAVVDFQNMFKQDVLDTWVDEYPFLNDDATGYIYQTTLWKINSIVCPGYQTFPDLVIAPNA